MYVWILNILSVYLIFGHTVCVYVCVCVCVRARARVEREREVQQGRGEFIGGKV
jgi:hypothetical protein